MATRKKGRYELIEEELARERAERQRQFELDQKTKTGLDPCQPWHPVLNPEPGERERQEQSFLDSWVTQRAKDRARETTISMQRHWQEAIRMIREGRIASYAALGQQFRRAMFDKQAPGKCYSAQWGYHLVRKLINRKVFTRDEITLLIKDTSSPFKRQRSKQPSTT